MQKSVVSLLAAALAVAFAVAAPPADAAKRKTTRADDIERDLMAAPSFLDAHPDLDYRARGWRALQAGDQAEALRHFRRAARYADKPSQGMIAEMHFDGNGVPRDRALAYAWMDLAAERGYEGFLVLRERYWNVLTEAERADAVARGEALYAEFGDSVAQPRMATHLRRQRSRMTGSRTGNTSNLRIQIPGPGGTTQEIDGSRFYTSKFWDPKEYQAWHDEVWMAPRVGRVDVSDLETVRTEDVPVKKPESRVLKDGTPD